MGGQQLEGGGIAIVVGHSLFIKTVFQTFLSDSIERSPFRPLSPASLRSELLPYCGVVGARFEWDRKGTCHVAEVMPLLGTKLTEPALVGEKGKSSCSCIGVPGGLVDCRIA